MLLHPKLKPLEKITATSYEIEVEKELVEKLDSMGLNFGMEVEKIMAEEG